MLPESPLIGVHCELLENGGDGGDGAPRLSLSLRYAEAVLRAGGLPVVLPPVGGPRDLERTLDRLDGLILSGGDDFDTRRLGLGPVHERARPVLPHKQDADVALSQLALERGMPVLGICYGMQLLGLIGGSRLFQHLPEDRPSSRPHGGGIRHPVRIAGQSRLHRLVEVEAMEVVSRHHQALSSVGPDWSPCAFDEENLIEAIEHARHPFAIGVQWHPELSPEGHPNDRLFRGLVGAAGVFAGAKRARSRCFTSAV